MLNSLQERKERQLFQIREMSPGLVRDSDLP
jgi:hypothetical protein